MSWGRVPFTEVESEPESSDEILQKEDGPDLNSEDEDIDYDITRAHGPNTSSEKRKAQNEIFKAFAAQRTSQITQEEVTEAIKSANDEALSIRDILAKQEAGASIINPRDYQTELFEKAKEENIIAVLDTGSGKTHIATLLLRHILDLELQRRQTGLESKTAFFLVDSVNLVFQQLNVLKCGLDQNVDGICGAMNVSLWRRDTWETLFKKNMVVVCTAEVLVQCLMHSFLTIDRINLLIFDEAHHAKKSHAYARLIKDYYLAEPDLSKRPRIFGMTASPVDAKVDVREGAKELETLLHCKIATTSDLALLSNSISRPQERVAKYDKLPEPFETEFHKELKQRYGNLHLFKKLFNSSKIIASELGRWAADVYWYFAFSEAEARKLEMRHERNFHQLKGSKPIATLDAEIAMLREAAEFVRGRDFGFPSVVGDDLSAKVIKLHRWLQLYYARTGEARCIIFVERRHTARLLKLIFDKIGGPNLHGDVLVGVNSTVGDLSVSLRNQVMTVARFRRGELNCLFSTRVAEEGLDIPQCNLVVRFDLYKTMISYVQSRGRARHKNSQYLHMIEDQNTLHIQAFLEARQSEKLMRDFCQGLPSDRLVDEIEDDSKIFKAERGFRSYTEPTTGAKLTYGSALGVVAHFVASLPHNVETELKATYVMGTREGQFICEVVMPPGSPINSAIGRPASRKAVAKRSAAFEMCLALRKGQYLDANLLPTYTKKLPAMRNALLALDVKKKGMYDMRIKPDFWKFGYGEAPTQLYLTVIDVSAGLERPHQPLGLLTRAVFPYLPQFPIYLSTGEPSSVISTPLATPIRVNEDTLNDITRMTLQVYHDIFAKDYEKDPSHMSYWLVPVLAEKMQNNCPMAGQAEDLIDWASIRVVCNNVRIQDNQYYGEYRWNPEMPDEFLADRFFVDNWDGGRRFYSVGVVRNMRPHDPVPKGVPKHKFMKDILDYSVSLWNKSRDLRKWVDTQPVVEVEKLAFRRNLLALVEQDEDEVKAKSTAYVCPEPFRISALTTRFVAMCYTFPAIIHRFDSYLVALDACELLGFQIGPALALEALTKDSDNSEEHGEERINYRSGMGPNYERLEFMGDCFLKMATSIACYVQQPDENEFEFHVRRMLMLCNENLFKTALKLKLYEYARTLAFSRRTWYPEGLKLLAGKGHKRTGPLVIKHSLGDKTVADFCEAFIGAAFMQHNEFGKPFDASKWDQAVKAVKTLVDKEDHLQEKWSDYYSAYEKPKYQCAEATASQLEMAAQIENVHPYHFKYPRLLRSAFIHPSQAFMWEQIPNYQRLEFLGDSLLDQVFVMHLFYRYPTKDPQWLTEHKMPMVSNKFLGALCVKLGLHTHLRHNNAVVAHQIREYVTEVQEAEAEAKGAVDYWMTVSEPPKCLADIIEAFVGALFVDSEFDFSVVQDFFDRHVKHFFEDMTVYDSFANNHPSTRLAKLLTTGFGCKEWRIATQLCESAIPGNRPTVVAMVQIHWKIYFDGTAVSGRYARIKAADKALQALEGLPPFEFRKRYECDCEDETLTGDQDAMDTGEVVTDMMDVDLDSLPLTEDMKKRMGSAI